MPTSVQRCASEGKEAKFGPADRARRLCGISLLRVMQQELRNQRRESASTTWCGQLDRVPKHDHNDPLPVVQPTGKPNMDRRTGFQVWAAFPPIRFETGDAVLSEEVRI